jgi:hypothetical protein
LSLGIETGPELPNVLLANGTQSRRFFRMAQIQYPGPLFVPPNVLSRRVTLTFSNGPVLSIEFDALGGGAYTNSGGTPGTVLGYNWIQDPYRGRLKPILFSDFLPLELHLDFDSATLGGFRGTAYPYYPSSSGSFPVLGNFSASP